MKSQYRGVCFATGKRKWLAYIRDKRAPFFRRNKFRGPFPTEVEAAQAYNEMAIEIYGDSAVLNVLPDDPEPPSPDEIAVECARIREGWTEQEFAERAPHRAASVFEFPMMAEKDLTFRSPFG